MATNSQEIDGVLALLRTKIRQRGRTQQRVEQQLGWGRGYVSQILTKAKAVRVDQLLLILEVLGIDPVDFWLELRTVTDVASDASAGARRALHAAMKGLPSIQDPALLLAALTRTLIDSKLLTPAEITAAAEALQKEAE